MIIFENGCWQTDSGFPDTNWLEGQSEYEQPKFVIPDNSELAVKIQNIQNPKFVTDDDGNLVDIVEGEPTNEQKIAEIKSQLNQLDLSAIRSLRAIAAGTATEEDTVKLSEIESTATELRTQLSNLIDK